VKISFSNIINIKTELLLHKINCEHSNSGYRMILSELNTDKPRNENIHENAKAYNCKNSEEPNFCFFVFHAINLVCNYNLSQHKKE
jgi:hypothetical protein